MNTIYFLLSDTKRGLVEVGRLINTDLETAKREAIRLAEELKTPVVIGSPVFDTRDLLEIDTPHVHAWERNTRGEMFCIHCGMLGATGDPERYPTREG